jgi:hypothetical protein
MPSQDFPKSPPTTCIWDVARPQLRTARIMVKGIITDLIISLLARDYGTTDKNFVL